MKKTLSATLLLLLFTLLTALPLRAGDPVRFYQSGAEKFAALLDDMQSARHHIHCEYFIFADDSIGHRMIDVMRQKAAEGVEVRLVIDGYYDVCRGYHYGKRLEQLRADGIDIRIYEPYVFPYVHRVLRDHRKIVVIDGRVGYTGGFNVADYNIQGKPGVYGGYVDTHVRVEGPAVDGLQSLFAGHFVKAGGRDFGHGADYYPHEALTVTDSTSAATGTLTVKEKTSADSLPVITVVERGRQSWAKKAEMRRAVVRFIDRTTDSLHIQSPYLLPTYRIRRALRKAQERGVKVEVLYSETGDTPLFDAGNVHYSRKLQRRGARVWLYADAFQHSKVLTADGERCLVGSANLDYRAMRWNEEVALMMENQEAVQWLDSAFVVSKENARPMDGEYYQNLPFKYRLKGALADIFLSWCL